MSRSLQLLSGLFVTTLIVSNIIAVKIGDFGGYFLPVAVIIFPLGYIVSDVVTEVYGFAQMRRLLWIGFLCNFLAVLLFTLGGMIPPAPFFQHQDAFLSILGSTPRILGASFIAYLIGGFVNSAILAKLKVKTQGKHLWLRTITSTILGQGLDSAIFITLAFYGIFPGADITTLIVTQWIVKVGIEILATPVTYAVTSYLKKADSIDHFDTNTVFTPMAF